MSGLRERKKRATRQLLSDVATGLFAERGFDAVTVAEIAEAANVSKMTVFNYFPRKEDLMLDRQAEAERLLTSAVRERLPDESVVAGPRRLVLGLLAERHPLSGLLEGSEWFWRVVDASPTLIGRLREIREELERSLAASLAEEIGREPDDPDARLLAGSVVAALGIVHGLAQRGLQAGRTADALYPELAAVADRLFDQIEHGIGPVGLGPADRSVG